MASKAEAIISRSLRAILADLPIGADIPDSDPFQQNVLTGLYWWLPGIIGEIHPEWSGMALDGLYSSVARKTGDGEAEILGQCNFIDDQTLTPIYLRLQIAPTKDEVSWLECKVGERLEGRPGEKGKHGMVRLPFQSLNETSKRLYHMDGNPDQIDWAYSVTYGQRRPFLTLLVLRTRQIDTLLAFYRTLGLVFAEEQHGNGPLHYAAKAGDLVFEIYPASEDRHVDSTTRLGFAVANVDNTIATLQALGTVIVAQPKTTESLSGK